jgi:long-chain acyl-CoA synthetase
MEADTIAFHALHTPDKPAVITGGDGEVLSYAALNARSNQGAHLLRNAGLGIGDALAVCIENGLPFFHVACAALRSGLIVVPVSANLTAKEIAFIVADSGAKALVTSPGIGEAFERIPALLPGVTLFTIGTAMAGYRAWDAEADTKPIEPIADECPGTEMLYSSGTTGRPKGIHYLGTPDGQSDGSGRVARIFRMLGLNRESVYLSPAPLYHSAPFTWAMGMLRLGGTVIVMKKFDPQEALALIEHYRINVSQWVPTHFVRMLKLPDTVRKLYDLSSLRLAVHAAAPCPVPVKQAMIDWWGPILLEYFGSSEQTALTIIDSVEWLAHPGSVGRCRLGALHICDDEGEPVAPGTVGQVYSEGGMNFVYHNDPEKTAESRNRHGWTTVGDLGYLDDEGYLYLTDRKNFMIISGGVNVYPQEIENLLVTHPRIADAAVIGTPDPDLGEKVTAIIQPANMSDATADFAEEVKAWLRQSLSGVKVPKRIEFREHMPRLPTGKMVKHILRQEYS